MNILQKIQTPSEAPKFDDTKDSNPRILFVCPNLNSQGFYRMILPYSELPSYGYHARLVGVKKWNFNDSYTLANLELTPKAIQWADYIVFKQLIIDYKYLFQAIKKHNPNVKLVMDIWKPLHGLPKSDPEYYKTDKTVKSSFLSNIRYMDCVTSYSKKQLNFYSYILNRSYTDVFTRFFHIPNFLPSKGLKVTYTGSSTEQTKIRIGILSEDANHLNVILIKSVLENVNRRFEDYITFVIIGNGQLNPKQFDLKKLPIEYHKRGSFLKYHQKLVDLSLDMVLLPVAPMEYNSYRSEIAYLECFGLKIPVIASKKSVFERFIKHGESGLLVSDATEWIKAISLLIEDVKLRKTLTQNAFQIASEFYTFSKDSVHFYENLYRNYKCENRTNLITK